MRKFVSLLLALCMLCSLCAASGEDWICASCGKAASGNFCSNCGSGKSTSANGKLASDSVVVQDMYDYMQKKMSFNSIDKNSENQQYRKFSGGADSYSLIDAYVQALCASGNFKLLDSYYQSFENGNNVFFSYALGYTGSGKVSSDKPEMTFKDNVYGDVTIYATLERSSCKGYITIVKGLEFGDAGLRSDGQNVTVTMAGASLAADLERLSDGSYQTADGRFQVKPGQAMVYRDGTACTTEAVLLRNQDKNREELHIDNFYRNESILLTVPYNSVLTGDTFNRRTIGYNTDSSYDRYMDSMESFLGWRFSNQILGVCHDGDYLLCYQDDKNDFDDVSIRIMSWDTSRQEAVFYIYASFDTAPYVYEAVAAVSMKEAQSEPSPTASSSDLFDPCGSCNGTGRCSTCSGTGRVTKWVGDQYMTVDCSAFYCLRGTCSVCRGTGHK